MSHNQDVSASAPYLAPVSRNFRWFTLHVAKSSLAPIRDLREPSKLKARKSNDTELGLNPG